MRGCDRSVVSFFSGFAQVAILICIFDFAMKRIQILVGNVRTEGWELLIVQKCSPANKYEFLTGVSKAKRAGARIDHPVYCLSCLLSQQASFFLLQI
jgi:hypothetical protein